MSEPVKKHVAHDRLTAMASRMLDTLEAEEEFNTNVKAIIMLTDDETKMNGTAMGGWDDDIEPVAFLLETVKSIMKSNGTQMDLMFMNEDGVHRA